MKWLVVVLGAWAAGAAAADVTVMRPRGFVSDEWNYYVLIGGKALADLAAGERVTLQVPADTRSLVIHCPKIGGGYDESRVDFNAAAPAFFALYTTRDCVRIETLDERGARPLVRQTVARANRRLEYDHPRDAAAPAAAPAAVPKGSTAEQVAAATAAWLEAFNSRDASRMAALYDPEAVLTDATEPKPRMGLAAIADYYRTAATRPTQRAALGKRNIRVLGDTAIDSGTLTYFEVRDGQASTLPARYSLTYRNVRGGWLIVHHQSTPAPR